MAVVAVFVVLNVLIAIISDAYEDQQKEMAEKQVTMSFYCHLQVIK